MKRKLLVLSVMLSCLLGLTACGGADESKLNSVEGSRYSADTFNLASIDSYMKYVEDDCFEIWYVNGVTPENFESMLYQRLAMNSGDEYYDVMAKGYDSWYKAVEDIGYSSVNTLESEISVTDTQFQINKDGVLVVNSVISGPKHDADFEMYFTNKGMPTDMGVTVRKSFSEKLQNAGLNTLLGMGMAFTILIIISLIISLFPMLFGGSKKKKESDTAIAQKAMDNTVNQIAEQEDLSSDAELVAVIAAAIAAYEGSGSTDGFRVRSIRKVNSNWKKY